MCKKHRVTGRENFGPGRAGRGHEGSHLYSTPWSHHVMEQRSQVSTVLIVTLGKSETYKETIKEKSTILPYSIHKRIHVRPLRNLIQGIHVNVNTIQSTSTVLKEAAIRNSGLSVQYSYEYEVATTSI